MDLSSELISQFVKVTKDDKNIKNESTLYGTIVVTGGSNYVKLDGSELLTPISKTTDIKSGERVMVLLKDHTAIVTGNLSSPAARTDRVEEINSEVESLKVVVADKVSTKDLEAEQARIGVLEADNVTINNKLTTNEADISTLKADNVTIKGKITSAEANIENLSSTKIDASTVEANYATIESLNTTNATISSLDSKFATIENLNTTNATISNLDSKYALISDLNAAKADITSLDSDVASINTLMFGSATGSIIQTDFANAVIAQLGDAQIKSAMIYSISAAKITSGTIDTNSVHVSSNDGKLLISEETIQIKDSSRVRVQIGKDALNDYSINVWDNTGKLMFSSSGITEDAIKSAIIRDDMVSTTANISASKLNIDSLFESINNNTTKTIKSTKVYLDDKKQTLDVAFTSMTTDLDDLSNTVSSQGTSISAIQGQITSKIWQQDIDNSMSELNTRMTTAESNIQQNKDNITLEVSNLSSSIDATNGNVTEISNRTTTLEQSTSGLSTKVTSLESTTSGLSSQVSTLEQTASGITLRIDELQTNLGDQIEEASKKATNYLNFSSNGLIVGDMTASVLGNNVLIDSNGIDIRNGTTVLASFEDDSISLGRYSENSTINLCGYKGTISIGKYATDDEYLDISSIGDLRLSSNKKTFISGCSEDGYDGYSFLIFDRSTENSGNPAIPYIQLKTITSNFDSYLSISPGVVNIINNQNSMLYVVDNGSERYIDLYSTGGKFHVFSDNFRLTNLGLELSGYLHLSGALSVGDFTDKSDFRTKLSVWNYDITTDPSYPGLATPDGTTTGYVRTPQNGLLPFRSGGYSNVGTSSWPFSNGYFNNLYVNGRQYATNKVLWSGGSFMNASQTCTLSESITSQPNGIILVWSAYSGGASKNYQFQYFFIPKYHISAHAGCGISVFLTSGGANNVTPKYVYVNDTTITGNDDNAADNSTGSSGITIKPKTFVLRYVIGV